VGAFAGTFVENIVNGEPLNYWEAAQGALFNVIAGNLPTKYLGHTLNKCKSLLFEVKQVS